jgi:hypothetical protein
MFAAPGGSGGQSGPWLELLRDIRSMIAHLLRHRLHHVQQCLGFARVEALAGEPVD